MKKLYKKAYFASKIFTFFKKFISEKTASIVPFAALAFPVVLGMAGLGTDASLWMSNKRVLQTAADAAVVAAGWEVAQETPDYMVVVAEEEAQRNGYQPDLNGGLLLEVLEDNPDGTMVLGLTLTQDVNSFFSKMIFNNQVQVSTYAEAIIDGMDGRFCMLGLDETASNTVTTSGSAVVNMPDCGIAVNSDDNRAMVFGGNAEVVTTTVHVAGDYDIGSNVDFEYRSIRNNAPRVEDPYADLEAPEHEECRGRSRGTSINTSTTLSPGVFCGGINISGNNDVTFEPGVYFIDGGNFKVTGGGSLFGEGVSFVLTGQGNDYAGLDISGDRSIEFSAPPLGEAMEGIVFYQDRNAPNRTNLQNKLVGTSEIIINGSVYFPSQGLWFGGDAGFHNGDAPCTKLIANTITLSGNPLLGNNCERYAVRDLGTPSVRLIR